MDKIAQHAKRIVLKLGTRIMMTSEGGLAEERLSALVQQMATLHKHNREILIVSSGSVGLGKKIFQPKISSGGMLSLVDKQACAAIGQPLLMSTYRKLFREYGLQTAQILLTALDFSDRKRYLNLKNTLEALLSHGIIPIINENDTLSTLELHEATQGKGFGDNDKLSALIASKLDADLLLILTNVKGIYTDNPEKSPTAKQLSHIDSFEQLKQVQTQGSSKDGRGGMETKLEAARIAAISGVSTIITSGLSPQPIDSIFFPETVPPDFRMQGTYLRATLYRQTPISEKKRWIALASGYAGVIVVNEGAKIALLANRASLLPIGIVDVHESFSAGDVVSIQSEQGDVLGRGLVNFSAQELHKIKGCQSETVPIVLGNEVSSDKKSQRTSENTTVVIHRHHLVMFQEHYL